MRVAHTAVVRLRGSELPTFLLEQIWLTGFDHLKAVLYATPGNILSNLSSALQNVPVYKIAESGMNCVMSSECLAEKTSRVCGVKDRLRSAASLADKHKHRQSRGLCHELQ